jgi:photosystem II stability/assembly factor-like uncharacterized protein
MKNHRPAIFREISFLPGLLRFLSLLFLVLLLFPGITRAKKKTDKKKTSEREAIPAEMFNALRYRSIGPFRGGRSVAVAGVVTEPRTFYFGGAAGGVWKTTDGGITWYNVSDKDFKTAAVGALAVAPSDPNVIYAGMGEPFIRGNMATGDGIYKSTDAGKTWQYMGLKETRVISQIVVDPQNPQVVFVAAMGHVFGKNPERGVYKSTDGGKTWKKVLYVNDSTGASCIAIDPHNPRILFAGMWQAYRKPWIMSSGGPGSGLYQSTDGGITWKNISQNPGLPKGVLGKITVSVSGANSNRIYAFIEALNGGIFRSDDGGRTWSRRYHQSELTQRAWYFGRVFADPKNENRVYAPQVSGLFRSDDGGNHFHPIRTPHGDNHVLWINPEHPEIMIGGNDGGASVTFDGGKSWSSENNQPTAQFYHVAVDHQFPYHIFGAQQDNSTVEIMSRTSGYGITDKDWWPSAGGESGYVIPDAQNPDVTYGGSYDGVLVKYNRKTGERQRIDVWPDNPMGYGADSLRDRFQWTFPILQSAHRPGTLYTCSQYVYRSIDKGMSWVRISPDLTRNDKSKQEPSGGPITKDNTAVEYYNTIFAFAESPVKAGIFWAGSDDGLIHVSTDNGKTWQNVTPKDLPKWTTISTIEPSHFDAGTAFVAARRYRLDDYTPYLYKTTDYGKHWEKITTGMPADESVFVIRQDTKDPDLLFSGTLRGVYVSFNGGKSWQSLQLNLPHVPVRDMAVQNEANDLVLATHGRAFWILDNLEVLRQMSRNVASDSVFLFQPAKTYLTTGGSFHYPGMTMGENPPNGLALYYFLKQKPDTKEIVRLTFLTSKGDTIISFSNKTGRNGQPVHVSSKFYPDTTRNIGGALAVNKGLNRFVWNLRYPNATRVPGTIYWGGGIAGPKVVPGTYRAVLSLGNKQWVSRDFKVEIDPRYKVTQEALLQQFDFLMQVHRKLDEVNKAILKIRKVRGQVNGYLNRLNGFDKLDTLRKTAAPILKQLTTIENRLTQTRSHAHEDPLNYPVMLDNKLTEQASAAGSSYNAPTRQERELFAELSKKIDSQLHLLQDVLQGPLQRFNTLVKAMDVPVVFVK